MWHLVRGNRVRNVQDRWPKTHKICLHKVAPLKIPMDDVSVQYNREHFGMHDDTDDEHSF